MNTTVNGTQDLNDVLLKFSDTISDVANPLFAIQRHNTNTCNTKHNAEWFDRECIAAQQLYKRSLNTFNKCKTYKNRQELCNMKLAYTKLIRKKKNEHKIKQAAKLTDLKNKNPKEFWNFFKHKKPNEDNDISVEEFRDYFSNLFTDIRTANVDETEQFCRSDNTNINNPTFKELNLSITCNEVEVAVKTRNVTKVAARVIICLMSISLRLLTLLLAILLTYSIKFLTQGISPKFGHRGI